MRTILLVPIALAACDTPPASRECTNDEGAIEGSATSGPTEQVVAADLTVSGVATQTDGHVIRRITVAGISAKNEGFNFETWSAVLPIGLLAGLPADSNDPNKSTIEVVAFDGCEQSFPIDSFEVAIDRTPGVRVERLALSIDFPGDEQSDERFLPADGSASGLIRIIANSDARGATVTLTSNSGTFEGVATGNTVVLSGDGTGDAEANVFFTGTQAQTAVITASTKTATSAPLAVDVAGPPTFIPAGATLDEGDSVSVSVFTDGKVESCQATPVLGLTITSGAANLMSTAAANDTNGDGRVDILVKAAVALTAPVESDVTCRDRYGQQTTVTFGAAP